MKHWLTIALLLIGTVCRAQDPFQTFAPFMMGNQITDWAQRVVANGGAMPSQQTIQCMENLRLTLIANSLTNKLVSLSVFVPDSLIAATTPLINHNGAASALWTNENFVAGDLTIQGLMGDGLTKALNTGVAPSSVTDVASGSRGMTFLISEFSTNGLGANMGCRDAAASGGAFFAMQSCQLGVTAFYPRENTFLDFAETNDWSRVGYVSMNMTTNPGVSTNANIFVASTLESHKLLDSDPKTFGSVNSPSNTIPVFAWRFHGTNVNYSPTRLSAAATHFGYNETESSNLWVALKTCRECLGGGTGDPVHEWNRRVVFAGGANISINTSNSQRDFVGGVFSDGLYYDLVAANNYPTDNLTAAITPVIWRGGHSTWVNVAFGETNLSVNGLTGNGSTKYLSTGINPVTLNIGGFSSNSAGLSSIIYANPSTAAKVTMGAAAFAGSAQFALYPAETNALNLQFYAWRIVAVNTDFLSVPRSSNWTGFLSGNRTASNAIRLDGVTNGVHNVLTNGTGANTFTTAALTNVYGHALELIGTANNISDQTLSFNALHGGLTQTKSSNLWIRASNFRTAQGGGLP